MYALNNNVTYFDSFVVEHIPKEIKIFIDKSIAVPNIFRIQVYNSVMCENIFVLELLILCLKTRLQQTLLIFFHDIISRYNFKLFYD